MVASLLPAISIGVRADEGLSYRRKIVPLLQSYCLGCHNRIDAEQGVSLQSADEILRGGKKGKILNVEMPEESLLWKVLVSSGDDHMPPVDQPQLKPEDLLVIQSWMKAGAEFDTRAAVMAELPHVDVSADHVRNPILSLAISSDGSQVVTGRFKSLQIHPAELVDNAVSIPIEDGKINDLQFSADDKKVLLATGVTGLSGRAVVVDLEQQAIVQEFAGHNDVAYAAVWSPRQDLVATAGYDRRILLHDAATGKLLREFNGHNGAIFDLYFSPDGTLLASASADATIKVWHVASGERLDTLSQPQAEQYSVRISPDGTSIYGSGADNRIRKWNLVSKTKPQINPLLISRFAHEGVVTAMTISTNGDYLATTEENGILKIWDSEHVHEIEALDFAADRVTCMAFTPDARELILGTINGQLRRIPVPVIKASTAPTDDSMIPETPTNTTQEAVAVNEVEPNDMMMPQPVSLPATITGTINSESGDPDQDVFQFEAKRHSRLLLEVRAARDKSPLDSSIEVLHDDGKPVLQARLQAVRDSYFTFRGKDSNTSDDFRMFNWQEMELNQYLYSDGEVVKLWLYPRGPDSGFKVYPGFGNRYTYFGTTPTSHALQAPAFIVEAHHPDEILTATGLPEFPVYFENDDDGMRQWGSDSRLMFDPPADGTYLVRIRDARDFQGADFKYQLMLRRPQPDFSVAIVGNDVTLHPGVAHELSFTATRLDGYDGAIEIIAENLPAGFSFGGPIAIQNEQLQAFGTLIAAPDAVAPAEEAAKQIRFIAAAAINGREVNHEAGGLKTLKLGGDPKVFVRILSAEQQAAGAVEQTPEITVWAGETVHALLRVERKNHGGLVEFGKEDSGRNMPHGVFVDNIGLNGLMLLSGQTEREIFITTAPWVPETSRLFHLKSNVDGIASLPVMLHVRHRNADPISTPVATTAPASR